LQFTAHYTPKSVQEATHLNRRLWKRAVHAATSIRLLLYLAGGIWLGIYLIVDSVRVSPINPRALAEGVVVLLVVAVSLVFASWRQNRQTQKALRAQPDEHVRLDHSGITITSATGASAFEAWTAFSSFHEGKSIVSLARPGKSAARAIPTDALTPTQAGELRSILLSHLPEQL
jgi:hypothetical protein